MADHIATPGSNADTSINGGSKGGSAPKDKACPFCNAQFTSSSLGRHLDLYIKGKNPKPPDGLHHVVEIRKMRGNITRRQPRNSIRKREGSTPGGTDGVDEKGSPREEGSVLGRRSPSERRDEVGTSNIMYNGKPRTMLMAGWEATGVMNHIPAATNTEPGQQNGEDREARRREPRPRDVSKQEHAKTTFEQKQKITDALDSARAAELALREILGSIRAANWKSLGALDIFDYDPLTLDFPALCLHCLPPPPTLYSSTPVPNPKCWNITPPGDAQYDAVRLHFYTAFRNYRNTLAISSTEPLDDLSYPPPPNYISPEQEAAAQAQRIEAEATDLEEKIRAHLHEVFAVWTSLSPPRKSETWTLELARSVGRKSGEIQKFKHDKEYDQQVITHLKHQNNDLSRLQMPREFRLVPPQTHLFSQDIVNKLGEMAAQPGGIVDRSVGFTLLDRSENLDVIIDRAVGRWKGVLRQTRGENGLAAQRPLNTEHFSTAPHPHPDQRTVGSGPRSIPIPQPLQRNAPPKLNPEAMMNNHETSMPVSNGLESIEGDADADADMEEDEYAQLNDLNDVTGRPYRMSNGKSGGGLGMEGIMNENASGGGSFGRMGIFAEDRGGGRSFVGSEREGARELG